MGSLYPPFEILTSALEVKDNRLLWKKRPEFHFKSWRGASLFNSMYAGKIAGTLLGKKNLYRIVNISVCGVKYQILEHVVVWALYHGSYPEQNIDHEDGNGLNNKIGNLKLATHAENMHNKRMYKTNSSGHVGVRWYTRYGKWVATGTHNSKKTTIGYFEHLEDAVDARRKWEKGKNFSNRHGK